MISQWLAVAFVGMLSIGLLLVGVMGASGRWRMRGLRSLLPGLVPSSVLLGIGGTLFTIDAAFQVGGDGIAHSPVARWWFLGPRVPGDALDSLLGSPAMAFLLVGLALLRWGVPSPREIRELIRQLGDESERRHALLVLLDIPILVVGGVAGGLAAGLLLGAGTAVVGAIGGGLLAWRLFGYDEKKERRGRTG